MVSYANSWLELLVSAIHLTGEHRRDQVARCGQIIDGNDHLQTMLYGSITCVACLDIFRSSKRRGGFSTRAIRPDR